MKSLFSAAGIRQFLSYFWVGGVSAIVEWLVFSVLDTLLELPYLLSTILAFACSTTVNWFLGRTFTFKISAYQSEKAKEILLVFAVSAVGLLFNLLLMYLFVTVLGMNTHLMKTIAEVLSTGIVFIWNFVSRKYLIYKV